MEFKDKLKLLRQSKNISQQELANSINVTRSTISNYEYGRNYPTNDILIKLCDFFNVPSDFLLNDKFEYQQIENIKFNKSYYSKDDIKAGKDMLKYFEVNNINFVNELEKLGITSKDLADLPDEAKNDIKNFIEFIRSKYGKKD